MSEVGFIADVATSIDQRLLWPRSSPPARNRERPLHDQQAAIAHEEAIRQVWALSCLWRRKGDRRLTVCTCRSDRKVLETQLTVGFRLTTAGAFAFHAEGSSAAAWARRAPVGAPVAAEKRDRPDVPLFRPCAGCCTRGTRHDICRSRRSGNRADTRRSTLERSRGRGCRIRDSGEKSFRHGPAVLHRPLRWRAPARFRGGSGRSIPQRLLGTAALIALRCWRDALSGGCHRVGPSWSGNRDRILHLCISYPLSSTDDNSVEAFGIRTARWQVGRLTGFLPRSERGRGPQHRAAIRLSARSTSPSGCWWG